MAERYVLLLGIEDYSGLWEVIWQFHTLDPGAANAALRDTATRAVSALLERGWVTLHHCQEPYGQLTPVDPSQALVLLSEPGSWEEPHPGQLSVRVGTTPPGRAAFEALPR